MIRTKHIEKRMNQRGITKSMIQIVEEFGSTNGDKLIIDRKECLSAFNHYKKLFQASQKMINNGGLVLVNDEGVQITTYRLEKTKGYRK